MISKINPGEMVKGAQFNELVDFVNSTRLVGGAGITLIRTSGGTIISASSARKLARITGSTSLATNRWTYDWIEVVPNGTDWDDVSGHTGTAYNLVEVNNDAAGVQGNGVDVDTLPEGFAIKPAPVGAIVDVQMIGQYYWFAYENAVDGECP